MLGLLLFTFEDNLRNWWLPLTALPYFILYATDVRALGHRWSDMIRVYALNLVLLPIQLGGVLASIRQALSGRSTPFARTPKVAMRTPAPPVYILAVFGIAFWCLGNCLLDAVAHRWAHATFALLNGLLLGYGAIIFIGLHEGAQDLAAMFSRQRPSRSQPAAAC